MFRSRCRTLALLCGVALTVSGSVFCQPGRAQEPSEKLSSRFIPDDAISASFIFPNEMMSDPSMKLAPIEVAEAAALDKIGINLRDVEEIKLIVGMPSPSGPVGGVVVTLSNDYDFANLNPEITGMFESVNEGGLQVYRSFQQPIVSVYQPDARTMLLSTGGYLEAMLASEAGGDGTLPTLVSKLTKRKGLTAIAVLEQLRPMITPMLKQQEGMLPPPLRDASNIAEYADALLVNSDTSLFSTSMTISFLGRDGESAERIETLINDGMQFASSMIVAQAMAEMEGEDAIEQAMVQYIQRLGREIPEMLRPARRGNLVQVKVDGSFATTGVLVGLLLPAVQSARTAARRMSSSNNLKQIGLAMHNHNDVFKQLPGPIRDENGKALLSWRVKVLPFVEQQALYEQFHLDEPWDSPHNIQLLEQMPDVYRDPGTLLPPGMTNYQLASGEGQMFEGAGEYKFRDVLDGLSNTIMGFESSASAAVEWTKPADVKIDLDAPLDVTGDTYPGGFHVLMGDGRVLFMDNSIDRQAFRAMLTKKGQD